jgi:ribonuclease R
MSIMKLSAVRRRDPYLERELKRYENPLPSREYILQILEEQGKASALRGTPRTSRYRQA